MEISSAQLILSDNKALFATFNMQRMYRYKMKYKKTINKYNIYYIYNNL